MDTPAERFVRLDAEHRKEIGDRFLGDPVYNLLMRAVTAAYDAGYQQGQADEHARLARTESPDRGIERTARPPDG